MAQEVKLAMRFEMQAWAQWNPDKFPCGLQCFAQYLRGQGNQVLEIDPVNNRILIGQQVTDGVINS